MLVCGLVLMKADMRYLHLILAYLEYLVLKTFYQIPVYHLSVMKIVSTVSCHTIVMKSKTACHLCPVRALK